VAALLMTSVFLVMGMALLTSRSGVYSASAMESQSAQVRLLARAGLQDARIKLGKDVAFPPTLGNRPLYTYSEDVHDPETHALVGRYIVTLDTSWRDLPTDDEGRYVYPRGTVLITSWGYLLDADRRVLASHRVVAQVDLAPKRREDDTRKDESRPGDADYYTNPNVNRLLRLEDGASF